MSDKLDRAFNWELDIEAALWDNEHHRHLVQPFLDIAEHARLVANPNIEAAVKPLIDYLTPRQSEGVGRNTELYRMVAERAIAAALTP